MNFLHHCIHLNHPNVDFAAWVKPTDDLTGTVFGISFDGQFVEQTDITAMSVVSGFHTGTLGELT